MRGMDSHVRRIEGTRPRITKVELGKLTFFLLFFQKGVIMLKLNIEFIQKYIEEHGWKQKFLVERSGLSQPVFSSLVRYGSTNYHLAKNKDIKLSTVARLAHGLGLNLMDILIEDGEY